jgi:cell volume regulation protein A
MTRLGARMLAFHSELSFIVRSFFFVVLGVVAEVVSRDHIVPILGILAALLLARFLAVQVSRHAVRDVAAKDTELLFWMMPRGLVTAVLALEIVAVRGAVFSFLPAMAFTVVLITNLFIIWGSVRASKVSGVGSSTDVSVLLPAQADSAASGQA